MREKTAAPRLRCGARSACDFPMGTQTSLRLASGQIPLFRLDVRRLDRIRPLYDLGADEAPELFGHAACGLETVSLESRAHFGQSHDAHQLFGEQVQHGLGDTRG